MSGNAAVQELDGVWRITCPFAAGSQVMAYFIEAPQPAIIDTGVRSSPGTVIGPALAVAGLDLADTRFISTPTVTGTTWAATRRCVV